MKHGRILINGGWGRGGRVKTNIRQGEQKILILNKRGGGVQTNIGDRKKLKSNKPEGLLGTQE